MANSIADARRSLVRAKEAAGQRLVEIENERQEIKASIRSLDAALKALGRSKEPKATAERPHDTSSDSGPNAATTPTQ